MTSQYNPKNADHISKVTEVNRAPKYPARRHSRRERKVLATAMEYTPATAANWTSQPTTIDDALDTLAASSGGLMRTVAVTWDQSVNGGTQGTIDLGKSLPSHAVVVQVVSDVQVSPVGTGGTITLNVPTDGNLAAAVTAGDSATPVAAFKTSPVKTTAQRELQATIATHDLTAGKVTWFVTYLQSA